MAPPSHTDALKRDAARTLGRRYLSPSHVRDVGLFDAGRVAAFLARVEGERDPVGATRDDIVLNHLLGIHILHQELLGGAAPLA
jgi:asparagine synthase (glutamine-hydrolysing)